MADAFTLVPVEHDPFVDAGAIPGLMGKPDARPQGLGPAIGFGLPIGMFGGVAASRAADSVADAAMLPGDVYQGKVQLPSGPIMPPQGETTVTPGLFGNSPIYSDSGLGFDRTMNMAGTLAGAGMPMAEAGAAGSFGGKLFHGSPERGLTELLPSDRGPLGPGVYATPAEQIAQHYAGEGRTYQLPREDHDIYRGAGHRTDEEWYGYKQDQQRLINAVEPDKAAEVVPLIEKMWSGDGYPLFARLSQIYGSQEGAQNLFKRAGFEGISGQVDGPETLLFNRVPLRPVDHDPFAPKMVPVDHDPFSQ